MEDIVKSGILGITLIITLVFSAPYFNDVLEEKTVVGSEKTELKTEKDIHTPL